MHPPPEIHGEKVSATAPSTNGRQAQAVLSTKRSKRLGTTYSRRMLRLSFIIFIEVRSIT
jgi:hypothetical protein